MCRFFDLLMIFFVLLNNERFSFTVITSGNNHIVNPCFYRCRQIKCLSQAAALVIYSLPEYILAGGIDYTQRVLTTFNIRHAECNLVASYRVWIQS